MGTAEVNSASEMVTLDIVHRELEARGANSQQNVDFAIARQ
jgi:hypothetical protein